MMALSPQTLLPENLNLLRNDLIKFDCGPLVYQAILHWGFAKPSGVKIIDHVKDLKIEERCGRNLKNWFKKNNDVLQKEHFSDFDITTLHDILPVLCYDTITQTGGEEYEKKLKDTNSIEYFLKEIKSFRNDVSHEYCKAKENPDIETKFELMSKCIRAAGALYGKDQSEIDGRIAHLKAEFDELVQNTNSSYENAVKNITNKIERECPAFMLKKYSPLFTVPLPGGIGKIDSSQIFESVYISVAVENKDETEMVKDSTVKDKDDSKTVFSSHEICNHVSNKFVVINGGPGSGKTTLMKNIFQNILEHSVNGIKTRYEGISRFRVPIFLECRTEQQNNLGEFQKESIPNFHSPKEVIYDAFKDMKGLVFLIDGFDEINDDCRKLVAEIISFCDKSYATCIVSGRVAAGNNFISNLKERNLSYNEMLIEPICEMSDQLNFLRRYGDKMRDVDSDKLVKNFEDLNDGAQKVFLCPILLASFISLFVNHRDSLPQLQNERSVYKAIKEIFSEEIEKKLRKSNSANPELKAKYLLEVFSDYSLRLFRKEKSFFDKDEFLNLSEDCIQRISNSDVDIEGLFSCILTPETSFKQDKALTYAFTHSTIQEYLAVGQINKKMRESKIDWNNSEKLSKDSSCKQFLECLGISTSVSDVEEEVERYGNIIKLLILETLANGELTRYTETFTAVVGRYFVVQNNSRSLVYLLDLLSSSNCDFAIASIMSDLRDWRNYELRYPRHIRPMAEILKKRKTSSEISFEISKALTSKDCANFGQLMAVLKDDSKMKFNFANSYYNYQPLNGEFYTQLKNSKCKVTKFTACVTLSEHLSSVMTVWRRGRYDTLSISTLSANDVSFANLEGHDGELILRVEYTVDCPSAGSNPVTAKTHLTITDIPADGRVNVYRIIKYLSPKLKEFESIDLDNCHLTDSDANELLKKLKEEEIRTKWGERTRVKEWSVNGDKSRDLILYLPRIENESYTARS